MNRPQASGVAAEHVQGDTTERLLPQLVADVYESAPAVERSRLLEHLMRPLGVLSLAVVANGIFSKLRFLSGWPDLRISPEDASSIRAEDVFALVEYVQQASWDVMQGLVKVLTDSPALSATAAATILVSLLLQRARNR